MPQKDRIRYVYVPLTAAVLGALVAVGTVRVLDSFGAHEAKVRVVDVVPNEVTKGYDRKPYLSIKLRNTGDRRAVLTRLHTRIYHAQFMLGCQLLGGSGTIETGRYSVVLPKQPPPKHRIETVLNQEIGPDEVDRFGVIFETPDLEYGMQVMYEVGLTAEVDDSDQPIHLGRFLLMTPQPLTSPYWTSWFAGPRQARKLRREFRTPDLAYVLDCYRKNINGFAPFLESSAKRSKRTDALVDYVRVLPRP
ncbi:MAG TPA: hypothetical protein VI039_01205 [Solirubrobacterales bacterium]